MEEYDDDNSGTIRCCICGAFAAVGGAVAVAVAFAFGRGNAAAKSSYAGTVFALKSLGGTV